MPASEASRPCSYCLHGRAPAARKPLAAATDQLPRRGSTRQGRRHARRVLGGVYARAMEHPRRGRVEHWLRRAWWLHSLGALGFGIFVMVFARKGLAHADKLLIVLPLS